MAGHVEDLKPWPKDPVNLLPRQRIFVSQYLIDQNATKAAIAAGYSPKTAASQGSRLLRNVKVRPEIEAETANRTEKLGISAERVLQGLAKLAFFDIRKLFNADGSPKNITELDGDAAAAITRMHIVQRCDRGSGKRIGVAKTIRVADRGRNLERLDKHLGLFTERVEVNNSNLAEELEKARKRVIESKDQQRLKEEGSPG